MKYEEVWGTNVRTLSDRWIKGVAATYEMRSSHRLHGLPRDILINYFHIASGDSSYSSLQKGNCSN